MLHRRFVLALAAWMFCALALVAHSAYAAPPVYAVVDLGVLYGGDTSLGFGAGYYSSAVGRATNSAGHQEAFYWAKGTMYGLGTLPDYTESQAEGVTEFAPFFPVVVGYSFNPTDLAGGRAFVSFFGSLFPLGTLGGTRSRAHAIAGQGFIVGESEPGQEPGVWHAFRTFPFSAINPFTDDLGTLAGAESSFASAVNNNAQVTGQSGSHAYRTAPFSKINPFTDDLGTLGGSFSIGFGINDRGIVAGLSNTGDISMLTGKPIDHAFLYDATGMHDLGTVAGYETSAASAINDRNQVVGSISNVPPDFRAMIWDKKNGMRDLNTLISPASAWFLQIGRAINNRGQIVGWGMHRGRLHAFLLRPL